ncbi:galactose mutarotase [Ramlibacter monticola]|uniref:Aldose 1-epimerase n=1 Tax=Ramlibacter monticola TaxID=1926872 RepID=A0A936Z2C9_9BURK|nr:aldose epimerase family protein [Ramlibacter monticola]MBL0392470.1 galactose mutarotase [Ramlibacter monticola]
MKVWTIANEAGLSLSAVAQGGSVTALRLTDRQGRSTGVVLGLPAPEDYARPHPHLGAIVGRYANRIARGCFTLEGQVVRLPLNDGAHTLHGGPEGFGRRMWELAKISSSALELRLTSEDGDQGFPGRLDVRVQYALTSANEWRIDYEARSERATVVNLSQHAYFNLAGGGDILGHRLWIAAQRYCTVDAGLIPQEVAPVAGTPFDFREPAAIGARIGESHPQLRRAGGYDHNWLLDGEGLRCVARLEDPGSGRAMEVHTTEPGLQFYSGNFLDGSVAGLAHRSGLCLETQHFPDSPNRPDFPSTLLRPGETFRSTTLYRFTHL